MNYVGTIFQIDKFKCLIGANHPVLFRFVTHLWKCGHYPSNGKQCKSYIQMLTIQSCFICLKDFDVFTHKHSCFENIWAFVVNMMFSHMFKKASSHYPDENKRNYEIPRLEDSRKKSVNLSYFIKNATKDCTNKWSLDQYISIIKKVLQNASGLLVKFVFDQRVVTHRYQELRTAIESGGSRVPFPNQC